LQRCVELPWGAGETLSKPRRQRFDHLLCGQLDEGEKLMDNETPV
jgi:hypothetical protein